TGDLDGIPLGSRLDGIGLRRDVAIQRAGAVLVGSFAGIVHQLNLVGGIGRASRRRFLGVELGGADADAAVALGGHAVLHVEGKIGKFLGFPAEEAKALAVAEEQAVADLPDGLHLAVLILVFFRPLDDPAAEILAIEEHGAVGSGGDTNQEKQQTEAK